MHKIELQTPAPREVLDITAHVVRAIRATGVMRGVCQRFLPHGKPSFTANPTDRERGPC